MKKNRIINKIKFILTSFVILSVLVACGKKTVEVTSSEIDELAENIGYQTHEVFDNLGLKDQKNVDKTEKGTLQYAFTKTESLIAGTFYQKILNFSRDGSKMYGFMYMKEFTIGERGHYDAQYLYDILNDEYEDRITDPDIPNSIKDMPEDYNDLTWNETGNYVESWRVDDDLIVELQLGNRGDRGTVIVIEYRIDPFPSDWTKST